MATVVIYVDWKVQVRNRWRNGGKRKSSWLISAWQSVSTSERVSSGMNLRLIFPQKWGIRKGKDWDLRKECKKSICVSEMLVVSFSSDGKSHFSVGILKEELPRVLGHLQTPSDIKVHEICVNMDGVNLSYVCVHGCLLPLDMSLATSRVCLAGWGDTGSVGNLCPSAVAAEAYPSHPRASQVVSALLSR